MSSIDPIQLRNAFGKFMTGVTVVATVDDSGTPVGFTANSFSSVSLDPPLLLVCPAKSMSSFEVFRDCDVFNVSVLAHDQQSVSNTFASPVDDRFSKVKWHQDKLGCPSLDDSIASFTCKRNRSIDAGDHIILLGEVVEFQTNDEHGLGYSEGGYFSLNMERLAAELQTRTQDKNDAVIAGALLEHNNQLLLQDNQDQSNVLTLPQLEIDGDQPSFDELSDYLNSSLGVAVAVGAVFSIFDHETSAKSSIYYRVTLESEVPHEVSGFRFHNLGDINPSDFKSKPTEAMIKRYISEHASGNHSVYIGTDTLGKTHKLSRGKA